MTPAIPRTMGEKKKTEVKSRTRENDAIKRLGEHRKHELASSKHGILF